MQIRLALVEKKPGDGCALPGLQKAQRRHGKRSATGRKLTHQRLPVFAAFRRGHVVPFRHTVNHLRTAEVIILKRIFHHDLMPALAQRRDSIAIER